MAVQNVELGTEDEQFPICPYCGYICDNYFEMEEGIHECPVCEKSFEMSIHREYTFTTKKIGGS